MVMCAEGKNTGHHERLKRIHLYIPPLPFPPPVDPFPLLKAKRVGGVA